LHQFIGNIVVTLPAPSFIRLHTKTYLCFLRGKPPEPENRKHIFTRLRLVLHQNI